MKLYGDLLAAMAKLAKRYGFGAKSAHADTVLAIEIFNDKEALEPCRTIFAHLAVAAGKHAQFAPQETFAVLQVISDHGMPFDYSSGILLEYEFDDLIPSRRKKLKSPIHRQLVGPVRFWTEDQLAANIMFGGCPSFRSFAGASDTEKVQFKELTFEDVSLKRIRITGLRDAGDVLVVTADGPGAAKPPKKKKRSDFLSILEARRDDNDGGGGSTGRQPRKADASEPGDRGEDTVTGQPPDPHDVRLKILEELGLCCTGGDGADEDARALYEACLCMLLVVIFSLYMLKGSCKAHLQEQVSIQGLKHMTAFQLFSNCFRLLIMEYI